MGADADNAETPAQQRLIDPDPTSTGSTKKQPCCCGLFHVSPQLQTSIVDAVLVAVYISLNLLLNLYNKWALSVLNFRIPLTTLAVHNTVIFAGLLLGQALHMCRKGSTRCSGFKPTSFAATVPTAERIVSVVGLATATAANYGMNIVALMLLAQTDNQVIRATIPLFCVVTTFCLERRGMRLSQVLLALLTVGGAVLTVVLHATKWKMNVVGLVLNLGANAACAIMMSYAAIYKRSYNMNAVDVVWYTSAPVALLISPFIFVLGEHTTVANFLAGDKAIHGIRFLILGSFFAFVYNIVHFSVIQRTASVYISIVGNFKMALVVVLSEIFVQNTHLPAGSIVGVAIVTLSFLLSWAGRELRARGRGPGWDQEIPNCCAPAPSEGGGGGNDDDEEAAGKGRLKSK